MAKKKCTICNGVGHFNTIKDGKFVRSVDCIMCDGTGEVSDKIDNMDMSYEESMAAWDEWEQDEKRRELMRQSEIEAEMECPQS